MKKVGQYLILAAVVIAFTVGIYIQFSVWMECRATNSFFYCMRALSR
jgi:hypothetical protein